MDIETQTATDLSTKSFIMAIRGHKNIKINHICHTGRSKIIDPKARKKFIIISILCIILMICQTFAGIISNSISLILDAAHLLVDVAGFMAALFAIWIEKRPPSQQMNFGWYRAEVIAILYVVVIIWFLVGILGFLALRRLITGNYTVNGQIMIIAGAISIVINFIMGIQLRWHYDDEKLQRYWNKRRLGRFINYSYNINNIPLRRYNTFYKIHADKSVQTIDIQNDVNKIETKMLKANLTKLRLIFVRTLADIVQSVIVLIVGIIIYIRSDWSLADLVLAFIFIIIIMITTFGILWDCLLMLMESTPSFIEYDEVVSTFLKIKGVQDVHNLRIWALNMHNVACMVHLDVEPDADPVEILRDANNALHRRYHFFETTIQIDQ